jgi:hypothetical protein
MPNVRMVMQFVHNLEKLGPSGAGLLGEEIPQRGSPRLSVPRDFGSFAIDADFHRQLMRPGRRSAIAFRPSAMSVS